MVASQGPRPTAPAADQAARERQHTTRRTLQATLKQTAQPRAFGRARQTRVGRFDIERQGAFLPQVVVGVLKR